LSEWTTPVSGEAFAGEIETPPAIAVAKQIAVSVNNFLMVPFPSWLQSAPRYERQFQTTYFFTEAFVASSHFISFVFSQSAFVFGASAANAGAVTAIKRAATIAELTILNDIFYSLGFYAFVDQARCEVRAPSIFTQGDG
jgi:hypothetical protein